MDPGNTASPVGQEVQGGHLRLADVFKTDEPGRGAYLSRMFAFFSEEIVRHWAACQEAPYCNVGRPVIWDTDGKQFHVLDFTLERRSDGKRYVAELKCEIEFEKYAFLELTGPSQVLHHEKGAAFQKLLEVAQDTHSRKITRGGKDQTVAGSILIWGAMTGEGRVDTMAHYGFADILSIDDMLADLARWRPEAWAKWVATRRRWTDDLFDFLACPPRGE